MIDWPPVEGIVALCEKHGAAGAARKMGVPATTLRAHLDRMGVPPEQRKQQRQPVADEALKEIHDLLNGT